MEVLGSKFQIYIIMAMCLLLCACSGPVAAPESNTPDSCTPDSAAPDSTAPDGVAPVGTGTHPGEQTPGTWQTISAEEARQMMSAGAYVLLDVRTEEEYIEAHIGGAVLIPFDEIELRAAELPDKDEVVLIYCRSGRRSSLAAETLAGMGYTMVYDFGGILDWPYETVSGAE